MASSRATMEEAARRLGYILKEDQKKVITSFIDGEDVFVVLPTGYGKSLCYQCLPYIYDKIIFPTPVVVVLCSVDIDLTFVHLSSTIIFRALLILFLVLISIFSYLINTLFNNLHSCTNYQVL